MLTISVAAAFKQGANMLHAGKPSNWCHVALWWDLFHAPPSSSCNLSSDNKNAYEVGPPLGILANHLPILSTWQCLWTLTIAYRTLGPVEARYIQPLDTPRYSNWKSRKKHFHQLHALVFRPTWCRFLLAAANLAIQTLLEREANQALANSETNRGFSGIPSAKGVFVTDVYDHLVAVSSAQTSMLPNFQMESFKRRAAVMTGDWLLSFDIQDAYFHVPIHPDCILHFFRWLKEIWISYSPIRQVDKPMVVHFETTPSLA